MGSEYFEPDRDRSASLNAYLSRVNKQDNDSDAPTKGLRSKRQLLNLFTVANSHYQLS